VQPVGSYCTGISRCTVSKTLNAPTNVNRKKMEPRTVKCKPHCTSQAKCSSATGLWNLTYSVSSVTVFPPHYTIHKILQTQERCSVTLQQILLYVHLHSVTRMPHTAGLLQLQRQTHVLKKCFSTISTHCDIYKSVTKGRD
jgi:hypothetical protein